MVIIADGQRSAASRAQAMVSGSVILVAKSPFSWYSGTICENESSSFCTKIRARIPARTAAHALHPVDSYLHDISLKIRTHSCMLASCAINIPPVPIVRFITVISTKREMTEQRNPVLSGGPTRACNGKEKSRTENNRYALRDLCGHRGRSTLKRQKCRPGSGEFRDRHRSRGVRSFEGFPCRSRKSRAGRPATR